MQNFNFLFEEKDSLQEKSPYIDPDYQDFLRDINEAP